MSHAAEIQVMSSAAMKAAYLALVPGFERATGHKVATRWIPGVDLLKRVKEGEASDLVILQVSELLPVPGIDLVGPLPPDIQRITIFSAGIQSNANEPAAARALIDFITAPAAAPVIRKCGMEPV